MDHRVYVSALNTILVCWALLVNLMNYTCERSWYSGTLTAMIAFHSNNKAVMSIYGFMINPWQNWVKLT